MTGLTPTDPTHPHLTVAAEPGADLPGHLVRLAWPTLAAALVVFEHGFFSTPVPLWFLHLCQCLALVGYGFDLIRRRRKERDPFRTAYSVWLEAVLGVVALFGVGSSLFAGADPSWRLVEAVAVILFLLEAWRLNVALSRALAKPSLLLPLSFATLILVGTLLLLTPRAEPHTFDASQQVFVPTGQPLTLGEALFTATSAVCVTGLTVRDTAHDFSPFGQTVIGLLIQLGGLGIIIFGSMLATLLGQSLSLKENISLRGMLNDQPLNRIRGFVRFIVLMTIGLELIGAAAMYPMWDDPAGGALTTSERIGMSLFHSVSAFCNAGFDITGNSLVGYRYSFLTHTVIVPLIVVGGLGFPALENLYHVARVRLTGLLRYRPVRPDNAVDLTKGRLSLHTKIVLVATLGLYLWGVVWIGTGRLMPYLQGPTRPGITAGVDDPGPLTFGKVGGVLADAHFMSVTSRTAGFNAMPMDELEPVGRFTVMSLMMVGGSPGSTAGGFKTTVIALLALSVVATVRQRPRAEAFGRTIADALVRKAATIGLCYLLLVMVSTMLLCISEPFAFQPLLFEAISASTTTGLSLGITGELTGFGRGVIIATMFLGRVGPLALLGAMTFSRGVSRPYRYAHEDVAIG
jgi:trk/ktr system potassium uptake protein